MKEIVEKKERVEVISEVEKPDEKHHTLLARARMTIDGGSVFEYNADINELRPCDWEFSDTVALGQEPRNKIVVNKNCIYLEALNLKNALKRVKKGKILFHTIESGYTI